MTVEDAKRLSKGNHILYNGKKYKVLHTKELRANDTNEVYINIKCSHKNSILWIPNKFVNGVVE